MWTDQYSNFIHGRKSEEFKATPYKSYPISENSSLFYGFNRSYVLLWIIPSFIVVALKFSRLKKETLDLKVVIFAVCVISAVLLMIKLLHGKKKDHCKKVRAKNKGNEILITEQSFVVSVGELNRSEPNSANHINGLMNFSTANGFEYLEIPFKECRSFRLDRHTLHLYPHNGALDTFELTIGDWKYDSEMLTKLKEDLLSKIPEEVG